MMSPGSGGERLRVLCHDADAPPLFSEYRDGKRDGYEPEVTMLIGEVLGRPVEWVFRPYGELMAAVNAGDGDIVICGQGITPERQEVVDFSEPYAAFDETVLVRAESGITDAEGLRGRKVAAIEASTNMALVETFAGSIPVAFDPTSGNVWEEMIAAVRSGDVDAMVDDDIVTIPLGDEPDLEVAFTVPTRNSWGAAIRKGDAATREAVDGALRTLKSDGRLAAAWQRWMPHLAYPFAADGR
jgi:polar amino acid transport system substrate-binding protein